MLENELREINDRNRADRNLRWALASLCSLVVCRIVFFLARHFINDGDHLLSWALVILFYGLLAITGIIGIIASKLSIVAVRTFPSNKNVVAVVISVLVLLAVGYEVFRRL